MKQFLFVIAVLVVLNSSAQQRRIDVQHYRFEITLTDDSDKIRGKALITTRFLQNTNELELDLVTPESSGKGMQAYQVRENGNICTATQNANKLRIQLNNAANAGDTRILEVLYTGIPKDGLIISKNKFNQRTFFGDNWPDRAKNWLPCVDDPADKASVEFVVTAPMQYQVVSNGLQVEESNVEGQLKLTHWKEEVPIPTKVMVIGVAEFAVQYVGDTLNVPIYSWVYPQEKDKAFYDYAQARDVLPFFINNIAPYPYRKLANVQSKTIFGGMENAGCIFYAEGIISGKRQAEDLLAHEIAHQWFGNMASEKTFAHLWLSEGFASYMTDLYLGTKYGTDSMNSRLRSERAQVIAFNKRNAKPVVDSTTKDFMLMLNANSYQKGAWVLHMLRDHLGPDVFMKSIRNYYVRYAGSNASTDDLRKVMEETSGKDLKAFFTQWLYTAGHPVLEWKQELDQKSGKLTITIIQQQSKVFSFPLEIEVPHSKGVIKKTLQINQKEQKFILDNIAQPGKLVMDPNTRLLFESSTTN